MAGRLVARVCCWSVESERENVAVLTRREQGSHVVVGTFVYGRACGVDVVALDDVVEREGES